MQKQQSFAIITYCTLVSLFIFLSSSSFGQTTKITGSVIDSTSAPLMAATVVLLQKQDSVMVSYGITDSKGNFVLNRVSAGEYFLQITYIGYGNFRQKISVDDTQKEKNLGVIFLSPKNTLLEQIVIRAEHVPIVINKDTIEYNADAFKTKPNAVVEDLLKRLPGVEVKRDGSIKAQGEDVDKVLVDGKEFFGNDPKIATQNLPAEVVDKVQVYDKKSDMAEFSGIDDGQEEKTINLALKEDKKNGYFGNIKGGLGKDTGNPDVDESNSTRYDSKLSINRFDNKLQLSILGMHNNINEQGFSFSDYMNFMGGMQNMMSGGGGELSISINSDGGGVPLGFGQNEGITTTSAGGLNFNYDLSNKTEWQSSYFINRIANSIIKNVNSQNLLGDQSFSKADESISDNSNLNHRINTKLKHKIDSTKEITWKNQLSFNVGSVNSQSMSETYNFQNNLENQSFSDYLSDLDQFSWNTDLNYRSRLGKPGRILTGNLNFRLGSNESLGFVNNQTIILPNGDPGFEEVILQDQESDEDQGEYGIRLSYTEPIGEKTYLEINASRRNYKNDRIRDYYDLDPNNPSSRFYNQFLSNRYKRDYTYDLLGTNLKINRKKMNTTIGLGLQRSNLDGEIISENTNLKKDFTYLLPSLRMDFHLGSSKNLLFNYRTRIQEPSIEQLQPIIDNSDPLRHYVGNPDLKPEYHQTANVHFMVFDQFTFTNFFGNINSRYVHNPIVNSTNIDSSFRQTIQPINVDYNWNTSAYLSFSTPIRALKSKVSIETNFNFNKGLLFVNSLKNNTRRWTNSYTLKLENRKKETIDIAIGATLGTNSMKYSESGHLNQNYLDKTYFLDFNLYLPSNWTFESSFDYTQYSEESFGAKEDLPIWKVELSKSFLNNDRGTLILKVFDLLDKSTGINRNSNYNYTQEIRTNTLGRYFLLSFNYSLSKFGSPGPDIHIEKIGR